MTCFSPLKGFQSRIPTKNGKYGIVFTAAAGWIDRPMEVPCGQCIGCRLERSRQWAIRCVHEASLYERNCFITLTYSDDNIPEGHTLVKKHFQDFMKRLRFKFGAGIRFFHCGEYGERFGRPHYHACLFNFDFSDKVVWKVVRENKYYISKALSELWPYGFCTIGNVSFESAAYVARYIMKKVTGESAKEHYTYIDPGTGEFYERLPEYVTMSRRPGIGRGWYERFSTDVYPDGFVVLRGVKMRPPRFYDSQYESVFLGIDDVKYARKVRAFEHREDSTDARLRVREQVALARISTLKRGMSDDS